MILEGAELTELLHPQGCALISKKTYWFDVKTRSYFVQFKKPPDGFGGKHQEAVLYIVMV